MLLERRQAFGDGRGWLAGLGIERRADERCVSLFCYAGRAGRGAARRLVDRADAAAPDPGRGHRAGAGRLGPAARLGRLRAVALPPLPQADFDRLLWSCDLNFVRGEDSLVRAIWAGVPFVWQAYPQHDGAHRAKLEAFLDLFLADAPQALAGGVRRAVRRLERLAGPAAGAGPARPSIRPHGPPHCRRWRDRLAGRRRPDPRADGLRRLETLESWALRRGIATRPRRAADAAQAHPTAIRP